MSDTLCATYRVFARNRRTKKQVCDYTDVTIEGTYSCRYKATSTAFVSTAFTPGCETKKPRPWIDELVIQRNGERSRIAWVGPVVKSTVDAARNEMLIEARDPSEWWNRRRVLQNALSLEDVDASVAWAAIRKDQDSIGESGLAVGSTEPVERNVSIEARQYDSTFAYLQQLEDVAWTVKAGRLYGPGATTDGPRPFKTKLDASVDWINESGQGGAVIICDGENVATKIFVRGRSGQVGEWPPRGSDVPEEGWHIPDVIQRDDLVDVPELTTAARQIWETYRSTPIFLASSSGSLRKGSPLCVDDLLPGRRYHVTTGDPTTPKVVVELANTVIDFVARNVGGVKDLHEDRVAVDFAPIGIDYDTDRLSV